MFLITGSATAWLRDGASASPRGFTLIELLVVIAVIAVLAALAMPVLSEALRAAERTKCSSNLHEIGQAIVIYTSDHGRYLPTLPPGYTSVWMLGGGAGEVGSYWAEPDRRPLNRYVRHDYELFHCPADCGRRTQVMEPVDSMFRHVGTSYHYLTWDDVFLTDHARGGRKLTSYHGTAGMSYLVGCIPFSAYRATLAAAGESPLSFAGWHDPVGLKSNVLFMDIHVTYLEPQDAESWPGFTWR